MDLQYPTRADLPRLQELRTLSPREKSELQRIHHRMPLLTDFESLVPYLLDELHQINKILPAARGLKRRLYFYIGRAYHLDGLITQKSDLIVDRLEHAVSWYIAADNAIGYHTDLILRIADCLAFVSNVIRYNQPNNPKGIYYHSCQEHIRNQFVNSLDATHVYIIDENKLPQAVREQGFIFQGEEETVFLCAPRRN